MGGRKQREHSDSLNVFLSVAVLAALEAGKAIMEVYQGDDFEIQLKSDDSPLTRADRLAHNIIVRGLSGSRGGRESKSEAAKSTLSFVHTPSTQHQQTGAGQAIHNPRMDDLVLPILSEEG